MGNCWASLFGRAKRTKNYFSGRYKEYNIGVEFENLIEDENDGMEDSPILTEAEREHLMNKRFSELVKEQNRRDQEIDAQLFQEEESVRLEEEAYNAAKREAARITKQARMLEEQKKNKKIANGSAHISWAGNSNEWNMANEEDDFESYLENVKARSDNARASGAHISLPVIPGSQAHMSSETSLPLNSFDESLETEERSKFTKDIDWEGDFVKAEIEETLPSNGSGDASQSVTAQNNLSKEEQDQEGFSTSRVKTNSFSIDEDSDDEFLDLVNNVGKNLIEEVPQSNGEIEKLSSEKKVRSSGFDIDIDKFLEELDAEI